MIIVTMGLLKIFGFELGPIESLALAGAGSFWLTARARVMPHNCAPQRPSTAFVCVCVLSQ